MNVCRRVTRCDNIVKSATIQLSIVAKCSISISFCNRINLNKLKVQMENSENSTKILFVTNCDTVQLELTRYLNNVTFGLQVGKETLNR